MHVYEVRRRKDKAYRQSYLRCAAIRSAVVHPIGYAKHYSRSHHAVIRVYDVAGNVIETCEPSGPVQRTVPALGGRSVPTLKRERRKLFPRLVPL
jgi:hypothetical protein